MTVFRVIDDHVVSEAEYRARRHEITTFLDARAIGEAKRGLMLSGERTLTATAPAAPAGAPDPIGKGLPLSILIREVYTGKYPDDGPFGDGGDIAVVSGVKNYDVFNATARALNFLVKDVKEHSRLRRPSPFTEGTSLVAYSPAVMTDSLTVGFEFAVADFPQEFVNSLSNAFSTLAGIPLLLPYSGYMLGAGALFKLVGNVGHALFDGIKFTVTDSIDFDIYGAQPAVAGFRIVAATDEFSNYQYTDAGGLVDAQGKKYAGDTPYIVVSLDGRQRDNLKTFAPTAASAAVLQRFFSVKDGGQVAIDTVVEGLQFVSDAKYRDQAMALKAQLVDPSVTDPARKKALQDGYAAAVKNIVSDAMKPK
ncbi:MAG: hypothetical protein KGJ78_15320 [Alphaproteobacteria bacterium]|nr:hypothetical protein [Alphaproteobacteria bacterium]